MFIKEYCNSNKVHFFYFKVIEEYKKKTEESFLKKLNLLVKNQGLFNLTVLFLV